MTSFLDEEKPLVSIGMPVFNGENFISEALDSLLCQNYKNIEIIISDNCSTDRTETICRKYSKLDTRIFYKRQPSNLGAVNNFLEVLRRSKGNYFMWASADDLWGNRFVEIGVNSLKLQADIAFSMTGYVARSRVWPIFQLNFKDPLKCIEIKNSEIRLEKYISLSSLTHKDNLVHALWRKNIIIEITEFMIKLGIHPIGGPMNHYALLKFHGSYCPSVQFIKRYRYLPPGHKYEPLIGYISSLKNYFFMKTAATSSEITNAANKNELYKMLVSLGFSEEKIERLIALHSTK
jgi:glycosyltransferase involved in cell wall biosynthesis